QIVELKVAMSCQGCVGAVKRVLGKLEGVDNFEIDLKEQKVSVTTSSLKPEQVLEAVSKSGKATSYWPEPPKGDANPPKEVAPKEVS
ncbi:hypothetical protein SELMODRAFT_104411, partial [Selaginella moellendorffii]